MAAKPSGLLGAGAQATITRAATKQKTSAKDANPPPMRTRQTGVSAPKTDASKPKGRSTVRSWHSFFQGRIQTDSSRATKVYHNPGVMSNARQFRSAGRASVPASRIVETAPTRCSVTPAILIRTPPLAAALQPDPSQRAAPAVLEEEPADLAQPLTGRAFHPRCPHATAIYHQQIPALEAIAEGYFMACHWPIGE